MISFDEAVSIIAQTARTIGTERVELSNAAGRVLSAPVVAAIDSPRADVSAMDGYAVASADLDAFPLTLKIVGKSFPGAGWLGSLEPRTCVRIFTGAPLPTGADRIVIQEQVCRKDDVAIIEGPPSTATWVRHQGKDFRSGDELLPAGRLLDPTALVATAGADVATVDVFKRPRLALLCTGDELVEPGEARNATLAVPDSVSLAVTALARQWGADIVSRERLRDERAAMEAAAARAVTDADVIVVTGGASVGERDFAKTMFGPLGLELLFSRISIRPGKPAWFGRASEKLVLGLPGNPTSALITARLLLAPLLAAMQGRPVESALSWEAGRLMSPLRPCDERETFHRARMQKGEVSIMAFQESHAQKTLAHADVMVRQPPHSPEIGTGMPVSVLRL